MRCPFCNEKNTKVLESRICEGNKSIRRRRECLGCSKRFTTYERTELDDLYVLKKNQTKELFSREKLKKGIIRACEKRPVNNEKIENTVDMIEGYLRAKGKQEVKSNYIGRLVVNELKKLDEVAYVRFVSVYKKFRNIKQFAEEVETLKTR